MVETLCYTGRPPVCMLHRHAQCALLQVRMERHFWKSACLQRGCLERKGGRNLERSRCAICRAEAAFSHHLPHPASLPPPGQGSKCHQVRAPNANSLTWSSPAEITSPAPPLYHLCRKGSVLSPPSPDPEAAHAVCQERAPDNSGF